jgi:NADPH-dependent 2,4-dienoyl-CoA reductase/sulfur reductase-like enzyme
MLTGPEYAQYYIDKIKESNVKIKTNTTVLNIDSNKNIIAINPNDGIIKIKSKTIILAMGCRERTRSQILVPGSRPAGIYTAGTAQRLINIDGFMPGKKIVILGSGDVGLIMARRFALEGAKVLGVYEIMSNPGGLTRNIVQCLYDYNIPLYLSHTVTNIFGAKRIKGVNVAEVNKYLKPILKTERYLQCDCLIISTGLTPEIELTMNLNIKIDPVTNGIYVDNIMESSIPGIFACGNIVHVFDLADDVTLSSEIAGKFASNYIEKKYDKIEEIQFISGYNIKYIIPQKIKNIYNENEIIYLRFEKELKDVNIIIKDKKNIIYNKKERIVKPSEILKIKLDKNKINFIENKILCVECRFSDE